MGDVSWRWAKSKILLLLLATNQQILARNLLISGIERDTGETYGDTHARTSIFLRPPTQKAPSGQKCWITTVSTPEMLPVLCSAIRFGSRTKEELSIGFSHNLNHRFCFVCSQCPVFRIVAPDSDYKFQLSLFWSIVIIRKMISVEWKWLIESRSCQIFRGMIPFAVRFRPRCQSLKI